MLMLHLGYESTAVVYGRSSLEVMDFGKTTDVWTRNYGLRVYGHSSSEVLTQVQGPIYSSYNSDHNL